MWIIEYLFSLIASIILISSLFIFKSFWAKTIKTYWIRGMVIIWTIISIIYFYIISIDTTDFNSTINTVFYWELCNVVSWGSLILMLIPSKINVQMFLPLSLIGPVLTILVPTSGSKELRFNDFAYWQFYFSHLSSLFSYLYIYLYGYTNTKLDWQLIRRSALFAFVLLTFVEVWNLLFMKGNVDPLTHPNWVTNLRFYPNYIFRDIFNNIGLRHLNVAQQYFLGIFVFGPVLISIIWTLLYFVRPIYLNKGKTRVKFDIHENLLNFKNIFNKDWITLIFKKIKVKKVDDYKKIEDLVEE